MGNIDEKIGNMYIYNLHNSGSLIRHVHGKCLNDNDEKRPIVIEAGSRHNLIIYNQAVNNVSLRRFY